MGPPHWAAGLSGHCALSPPCPPPSAPSDASAGAPARLLQVPLPSATGIPRARVSYADMIHLAAAAVVAAAGGPNKAAFFDRITLGRKDAT